MNFFQIKNNDNEICCQCEYWPFNLLALSQIENDYSLREIKRLHQFQMFS